MTTNLSWNDRFALIDYFLPSDPQICVAFGLTQDELDTARDLRAVGTFKNTPNFDAIKYDGIFNVKVPEVVVAPQPPADVPTHSKTTVATQVRPQPQVTVHTKPESATRRVKEPQKRGRKGDKIVKALLAVPTSPVSVDAFIAEHGVSLAVLRQSKRFVEGMDATTAQTIGRVNVRQDKVTRQLMIWRETT